MGKKKGILLIGLVLLIALGGVVYAHWQQTLTVNATVSSGTITMAIENYGTDDDGIVGNDHSGNDNNSDVPPESYDAHGALSSDDPGGMYRMPSAMYINPAFGGAPGALLRYPKDVGICTATLVGQVLTVTVSNVYPSYFCTMEWDVVNRGTVPVKLQGGSFNLTKTGGPAAVLATAGYYMDVPAWGSNPTGFPGASFAGIHELTFDFVKGMWCGTQLDPTESQEIMLWVHIEQGDDPGTVGVYENSTMGKTYQLSYTMDFVNYNEFSKAACPPGSQPEDYGLPPLP